MHIYLKNNLTERFTIFLLFPPMVVESQLSVNLFLEDNTSHSFLVNTGITFAFKTVSCSRKSQKSHKFNFIQTQSTVTHINFGKLNLANSNQYS